MEKTTLAKNHHLIEYKTKDILYYDAPCNKAFSGIIHARDINTRKIYLINLIKNIVLKFHLY